MAEYRIDPGGLAALAAMLRDTLAPPASSCDGDGLTGTFSRIEVLAEALRSYAGHDEYTTEFHPAREAIVEGLNELKQVARAGVENLATNIETMVATGVDTDHQNAQEQQTLAPMLGGPA